MTLRPPRHHFDPPEDVESPPFIVKAQRALAGEYGYCFYNEDMSVYWMEYGRRRELERWFGGLHKAFVWATRELRSGLLRLDGAAPWQEW